MIQQLLKLSSQIPRGVPHQSPEHVSIQACGQAKLTTIGAVEVLEVHGNFQKMGELVYLEAQERVLEAARLFFSD